MFDVNDQRFMARALELAGREVISPHPNPRVGCVLVKEGRVIGEGWHRRAGEIHAEVVALNSATSDPKGATAYVTLEPCCHHGKTPPCSQALIDADIKRVVAAMRDPSPTVDGGGFEHLEANGIAVVSGLMEAMAQRLNQGFIKRMTTGRPWIRVKSGMSLDGRTALADGQSQWITSAQARKDVQRWRARADAILTGIGTVLQDDPRLSLRQDELGVTPWRQPMRVIVDSRGKLAPTAKLFEAADSVFHVVAQETAWAACPESVLIGDGQGQVDLPALMDALGEREINEVQVEAGPMLVGALLRAGLVDEWLIYLAPVLLGDDAKGLVHLPHLGTMADRINVRIDDIRAIGPDWRIRAVPNPPQE